MKLQRITTIILTLCLITSLLAVSACSTGNPHGSGDNSSAEGTQTPDGTGVTDPSTGNAGSQNTNTSTQHEDLVGVAVPQSALISADDLRALKDDFACRVIDMRTFAEFTIGSVPEAVSIPLRFLTRRYMEIPDDMTIVVTTSNEEEMALVYGTLLSLGFDAGNLFFLEGGFEAWEAAGYQVQVHYGTGC